MIIFLSFACGALSAALDLFDLPDLPSMRILFGLFLGCLLFLSASGFGRLLLPAGMVLYGHFSQSMVLAWYSEVNGNNFHIPNTLILSTISVPLVYLSVFHGLCASLSLRKALYRASPTASSEFQSELAASALLALFTLSFVFYFT